MRSSGKQKSDPKVVTGSVLKHVLKDTLKAAAQSDGLAKVMLASTPGLRVMLDTDMFAEALVAFETEGFGKLTFTEMSAFIKEQEKRARKQELLKTLFRFFVTADDAADAAAIKRGEEVPVRGRREHTTEATTKAKTAATTAAKAKVAADLAGGETKETRGLAMDQVGKGADGRSKEVHTALKVLFDTLDANKNGVVEKGEILSVLRNPDNATVELIRGVPALAGLLKPQHYAATLNAMDTNKDGSMQFDELVTFCEKGQHRQAGQMEETKKGKGEAKKKEDEEEKEEEVKVSKLSILTTLRDNHTARKIMAEAGRRDPWAGELLDAETYGESILDMQVRIAIVMSYGANIFHAVYLVEKCVLTLTVIFFTLRHRYLVAKYFTLTVIFFTLPSDTDTTVNAFALLSFCRRVMGNTSGIVPTILI